MLEQLVIHSAVPVQAEMLARMASSVAGTHTLPKPHPHGCTTDRNSRQLPSCFQNEVLQYAVMALA